MLAGHPKQAPPIADEPLRRVGEYAGRGLSKPAGSDATPSNAWSTHRLVRNGMGVMESFQDAVLLRQVHRYVEENKDVPRFQTMLLRFPLKAFQVRSRICRVPTN